MLRRKLPSKKVAILSSKVVFSVTYNAKKIFGFNMLQQKCAILVYKVVISEQNVAIL